VSGRSGAGGHWMSQSPIGQEGACATCIRNLAASARPARRRWRAATATIAWRAAAGLIRSAAAAALPTWAHSIDALDGSDSISGRGGAASLLGIPITPPPPAVQFRSATRVDLCGRTGRRPRVDWGGGLPKDGSRWRSTDPTPRRGHEPGEPRWSVARQELRRRTERVMQAIVPHHRRRGRVVADVLVGRVNVGVTMDAEEWSKAACPKRRRPGSQDSAALRPGSCRPVHVQRAGRPREAQLSGG
jgi:hypothetical protein